MVASITADSPVSARPRMRVDHKGLIGTHSLVTTVVERSSLLAWGANELSLFPVIPSICEETDRDNGIDGIDVTMHSRGSDTGVLQVVIELVHEVAAGCGTAIDGSVYQSLLLTLIVVFSLSGINTTIGPPGRPGPFNRTTFPP